MTVVGNESNKVRFLLQVVKLKNPAENIYDCDSNVGSGDLKRDEFRGARERPFRGHTAQPA